MRRFSSKAGSALIWALAVALILSIVLIAGVGMVQRQQNANVQQHIENQAYFTAMSVNRMVMNWLNGSDFSFVEDEEGGTKMEAATPQGRFILEILKQPINTPIPIQIDAAATGSDLDGMLGSFQVYVSRDENDVITFRTEAEYFEQTASVSGTMRYQTDKWLEGGGYAEGIQRIEVPPMPWEASGQYIQSSDPDLAPVNWTGFQSYTSGNGNKDQNYKITSADGKSPSLDGLTANILVVGSENNSGKTVTPGFPDNKTSITTLIVKDGGYVRLESNGIKFDEIVVEDGGTVEITKSNLGVLAVNPTKKFNERTIDGVLSYDYAPLIYIKAGGQLRIASGVGGNITPLFTAYVYANPTPPPNRPAIDFGAGKIEFRSIIVQPSNPNPPVDPDTGDLLFPPSWPADIGDMNGILIPGAADSIHLPIGYGGFNTDQAGLDGLPTTLLQRSCNHLGPNGEKNSSVRKKPLKPPSPPIPGYSWKEDPFCPHFLALYEPPLTVGKTAWWIDRYEEG